MGETNNKTHSAFQKMMAFLLQTYGAGKQKTIGLEMGQLVLSISAEGLRRMFEDIIGRKI